MELAHSLLLNEDALAQITEAKRPVFIFEWLRFLDKVLVAANKVKQFEKSDTFAHIISYSGNVFVTSLKRLYWVPVQLDASYRAY